MKVHAGQQRDAHRQRRSERTVSLSMRSARSSARCKRSCAASLDAQRAQRGATRDTVLRARAATARQRPTVHVGGSVNKPTGAGNAAHATQRSENERALTHRRLQLSSCARSGKTSRLYSIVNATCSRRGGGVSGGARTRARP